MKSSKPSSLLMGVALVAGLALVLAVLPVPAHAASPPPAPVPNQGWVGASCQMGQARFTQTISSASLIDQIPGSLPPTLEKFEAEETIQMICLNGWHGEDARRTGPREELTTYWWAVLNNQEEEPFQVYLTFPALAAVLFLCGRLLAHKLRR